MSNNILGISAFYHDSAAALLMDGQIVAAAQEERFTRKKADSGFPSNAISYCLDYGGLRQSDLTHVVFYENPYLKFERIMRTFVTAGPSAWRSFQEAFPAWASNKLNARGSIASRLPAYRGDVLTADHHESHAASAFFPSPFTEAAILTVDAVGEWATSSIGFGRNNSIDLIQELRFPHSLGMLYSAFTYYCGFKVNSGEYKLMGLAPYGEPKYVDCILDKVVTLFEDGSIKLDMSYFDYIGKQQMTSERFNELFGGAPRQAESMLTQRHMDLAASIQRVCEEVVLKMARHAHTVTQCKNLVLSGGVALNCVANGRIQREGPFDRMWVQPAAGDAGGALGAALLAWHHGMDKERRVDLNDAQMASLLGPVYANEDIGILLDSLGARYDFVEDEETLLQEVVEHLSKGRVIGWFHGRMEYGPRSLGARSIIGDARSTEMQQIMNLKIKFRESFRPFAPCVLRENAHEIFEMEADEESPYMLLVASVREELRSPLSEADELKLADSDLRTRLSVPRSVYPAITHVDYSARVQTVDEQRHGRFYRLMKRFYDVTRSPVIVNTSFNVRGEPIVNTPEDAYRCFMATEMDCLVLENHILLKTMQDVANNENAKSYISQYELD